MDPRTERCLHLTRRSLLNGGISAAVTATLCTLIGQKAAATCIATTRKGGLPDLPHHPPTAKRFIYLFMNGGPSQMDLYDYKPTLDPLFDKDLPDSVRQGQRITTMTSGQTRFPMAPSMFKFDKYGQCGRYISELLPHTSTVVDDLSFIYSVHMVPTLPLQGPLRQAA